MNGLLILVLVQVVVAALVIWGLKYFLNKELMEAALEELQGLKCASGVENIVVRSSQNLPVGIEERLKNMVGRKFKDVPLVFEKDNLVQGGMVIVAGGLILDFSLKNRIKYLFS